MILHSIHIRVWKHRRRAGNWIGAGKITVALPWLRQRFRKKANFPRGVLRDTISLQRGGELSGWPDFCKVKAPNEIVIRFPWVERAKLGIMNGFIWCNLGGIYSALLGHFLCRNKGRGESALVWSLHSRPRPDIGFIYSSSCLRVWREEKPIIKKRRRRRRRANLVMQKVDSCSGKWMSRQRRKSKEGKEETKLYRRGIRRRSLVYLLRRRRTEKISWRTEIIQGIILEIEAGKVKNFLMLVYNQTIKYIFGKMSPQVFRMYAPAVQHANYMRICNTGMRNSPVDGHANIACPTICECCYIRHVISQAKFCTKILWGLLQQPKNKTRLMLYMYYYIYMTTCSSETWSYSRRNLAPRAAVATQPTSDLLPSLTLL